MPEKNTVPCFLKEDFFREGESVYVQLSDEFKDFVGIMHSHEFIEVTYILSGRAKHIIDGRSFDVKKGDISVINCKEEHAFIADESYDEKFIAYDLMFTPDFLSDTCLAGKDFSMLSDSFLFFSLFPDEAGYSRRLNLIENCNFEFGAIFDKIYYEYKNRNTGYINLIRVYTAELIIKLFRKIQSSDENRLTKKQKQIVNSCIEYIKNNYNLNIKMEDISSKLFFNKNYIAKLFKAETGMPVSEFIREIRMTEACRQLLNTDNKISDIASSCGYNDMKTFYSAFKKSKGMTPKDFKSNTNKNAL